MGLVYSSCDIEERNLMYEELTSIIGTLPHPLLLMGDFNGILNIQDRRGKTRVTESMRQFNNFIHNNGLLDVRLSNMRYPWARGNFKSKLYRCLCDPS